MENNVKVYELVRRKNTDRRSRGSIAIDAFENMDQHEVYLKTRGVHTHFWKEIFFKDRNTVIKKTQSPETINLNLWQLTRWFNLSTARANLPGTNLRGKLEGVWTAELLDQTLRRLSFAREPEVAQILYRVRWKYYNSSLTAYDTIDKSYVKWIDGQDGNSYTLGIHIIEHRCNNPYLAQTKPKTRCSKGNVKRGRIG